MVQAYAPSALNQSDKLVRAYELVIDATPKPTFDQYRNLAIYSYVAGQTRKGDLRGRRRWSWRRRTSAASSSSRSIAEERGDQAGDPVGRGERLAEPVAR